MMPNKTSPQDAGQCRPRYLRRYDPAEFAVRHHPTHAAHKRPKGGAAIFTRRQLHFYIERETNVRIATPRKTHKPTQHKTTKKNKKHHARRTSTKDRHGELLVRLR